MIKVKDYYIPADDSHYLDYFKRFDHYQESQRNRSLAQVLDWRLAIDIGANIGLWSRDLSEYFDKTICFEPNKKISAFFLILKEIMFILNFFASFS